MFQHRTFVALVVAGGWGELVINSGRGGSRDQATGDQRCIQFVDALDHTLLTQE